MNDLSSITTFAEVRAVIDEFTDRFPRSNWGPAHIAIEDYNLYDSHIDWCIELIDGVLNPSNATQETYSMLEGLDWYSDYSHEEMIATRDFLISLKAIPEQVRSIYTDEQEESND